MKIYTLAFLFAVSTFAQTDKPLYDQRMDKVFERSKLEENLVEQQKKKQELEQELSHLKDLRDHWRENKESTLQEIKQSLKDMSFPARTISKRAAFFRCVRDAIEGPGYVNVDACRSWHQGKFTPEDEVLMQKWKRLHAKDRMGVDLAITNSDWALKRQVQIIETSTRTLAYNAQAIANLDERILVYEAEQADKRFIESQVQYTNCDENTPTVNLEEEKPYPEATFKGPFVGIPRDNQDGIGSCFANAAKNLLVGLSGGEDNASFLDMALQYQTRDGKDLSRVLDGGQSCETLRAIEKAGYCPQEFSPIEQGEKNTAAAGIFGPTTHDLWSQSQTLDALGSFAKAKKLFDGVAKNESKLRDVKALIADFKANPDVTIPLPVLRLDVIPNYKIEELYYHRVKPKQPNLKMEEFKQSFQAAFASFKPAYAKALLGGKGLGEIFDLGADHLKDWIDRYELRAALPEMRLAYVREAQGDFNRPNLVGRIKASLDFVRRNTSLTGSDDELIAFCQGTGEAEVTFLTEIKKLLDHLRTRQIGDDKLLDAEGKLKDMKELMQLAIAPSCLSADNRKKLDFGFTCMEKNLSKQAHLEKRKFVLASLLKGVPVGSTFGTLGSFHINSLVGMRFNKETKACEYLVRESQIGSSIWTSEKEILDKTIYFTEVRRK